MPNITKSVSCSSSTYIVMWLVANYSGIIIINMCCTYSQLAIASYVLVINSEKMKVCPDITELCKHDYSYVYYVLLFLAQAIATWSKSKENRTVILCIANCLYVQCTYIYMYTVPLFVPYTRKSFYFCCLKVCKISQKSGWMLTHTCTHTQYVHIQLAFSQSSVQ